MSNYHSYHGHLDFICIVLGVLETKGISTPEKRGIVARGGRQRRSRIPDKPDINFRYYIDFFYPNFFNEELDWVRS